MQQQHFSQFPVQGLLIRVEEMTESWDLGTMARDDFPREVSHRPEVVERASAGDAL